MGDGRIAKQRIRDRVSNARKPYRPHCILDERAYVRAKAEMQGLEGKGGWMGRAERMLLILLGTMVVGLGLEIMEPLLWVFVVLTGFTVFQRIRRTWQQLDS